MYHIQFQKPIFVHFIGIGGISMSGLASILLKEGFRVSGSDVHASALTRQLAEQGACIHYGHSAANVSPEVKAVVYTAAVKEDNPEIQESLRLGIPLLTRAELLGQLMKNYRTAIGISGTHGKTTATSMMTHILLEANADPTVSVGGILHSIGGNIRVGGSDYFVAESCEYTNSFLSLYPTMEIILNIRADHLDFFKDLDDIRRSFRLFAEKLGPDGFLSIYGEIEQLEQFTQGLSCKIRTFGSDPDRDDYSAVHITYDPFGCASYDLTRKTEHGYDIVGSISLGVPGFHNVLNSLSVIAVALELGIPMEQIRNGLASFTGTDRRFQRKGEFRGVTVIDDYAHHPDEIEATLKAAHTYPHKKIWCVFQPHTYTRTKALMDGFARSLCLADEVVLADIYPARETDTLGISSLDLANRIQSFGTSVHYFPSFEQIEQFLSAHCAEGDLLITMGAGDIVSVGEALLERS